MVAPDLLRQTERRVRHAVDQLPRRMLRVGEKRVVKDGNLEQGNLQPADDGLDDFRKVRRGEDGVENHRQRVERDGRRLSKR